MQEESRLGRFLWMVVLSATVAAVIFSFARHPLLAGDGEASGFNKPMTLWVTGSEDGGQAETVARQLAGCWQEGGRSVTVGVLPGGSSSAVLDFLDRVHDTPNELLLITDTTLSDIVRDRANTLLPEPRERAQRALGLLARAASISVLDGNRLELAVRASSPVHTSAELLALLHEQPARPLFGVAADSWLQGNLAALVQRAELHGEMPYSLYTSSRGAILSLETGQVQAVLAPAGALAGELRRGHLRELPWPAAYERSPRTWVAVMAPTGLDAGAITTLRHQARAGCGGTTWNGLLHADGLSPLTPESELERFVGDDIREATRLQALATQIMRAY